MTCKLIHGPASPVYLVDGNGQPLGGTDAINITGTVDIDDGWEVILLSDVTANSSNKLFAVPVGYIYQVMWVYVQFTSTATAGARLLTVAANNNAGTQIFEDRCGVTQAASLTYNYSFGPSLADLTAVRDTTFVMTPLHPTFLLLPLWQIRIWDQNAVDAGADDMSAYIVVARKAV